MSGFYHPVIMLGISYTCFFHSEFCMCIFTRRGASRDIVCIWSIDVALVCTVLCFAYFANMEFRFLCYIYG